MNEFIKNKNVSDLQKLKEIKRLLDKVGCEKTFFCDAFRPEEEFDDRDNFNYRMHFALRLAVKRGKYNLVKLFLQIGADPNFSDGEPLGLAAEYGFLKIARILLRYGARVNENAIRLAEVNLRTATLRLLMKGDHRQWRLPNS